MKFRFWSLSLSLSLLSYLCASALAQNPGLAVSSSDYLMTWGTQLYTSGSITYCLTYRIVQSNGTIYDGKEVFTTTGEAFAPHFTQVGATGMLVGVTIFASDPQSVLLFGTNYLQVFLTQSNTVPPLGQYNAGTVELIGGTAAAQWALSWPTSPVVQSLDSRGLDLGLTPQNPGAGNVLNYALPFSANAQASLRYRIKNLEFIYTSSATVGARVIQVLFNKGDGTHEYQAAGPAVQPASTTGIYNFGAGMAASNIASSTYLWQTQGFPEYLDFSAYDGPHNLYVNAIGMQPGDAITSVVLRVESWNDSD